MSINNSNKQLLENIVNLMQRDDAVDAPADSVKWAKNLFRTRAAEPTKSIVQKVLAVLQLDLSGTQAAFGERSAQPAQTRQMLFDAGENSLDLRISETENGFGVRGQILGEGFANAAIKLGDFETMTNELSEFNFDAVQAGKYELTVKSDEKEISIENLEIK